MPHWLEQLLNFFRRKPAPVPTPPPPPATDVLATLHSLHNAERIRRGADVLSTDARLMMAAQKHAAWMAETFNLSHVGDGGLSFWERLQREGYQPDIGGENIAQGYRTPQDVTVGWMGSAGHRQNILNPAFSHVGYGVASGGGSLYWCAVFAAPFSSRATTVGSPFEESLPEPLSLLEH